MWCFGASQFAANAEDEGTYRRVVVSVTIGS